jgi:uncharacterized protein
MTEPAPPHHRRDIAALIFACVFPTVAAWLYFGLFAGRETLRIAYGAGKLIQFSFPAAWAVLAQRRPIRWPKPRLAGTGIGLLFAIAASAGILALYFGWLRNTGLFDQTPHELTQRLQPMGVTTTTTFVILALFYSFIHSFLEEYYWRWFVYGQMRRFIPIPVAIWLSAAAFTAHHVVVLFLYFDNRFWPMLLIMSAGVAVGGAFWAWLYQRSGSLIAPWISHIILDIALMIIGYDLLREMLR